MYGLHHVYIRKGVEHNQALFDTYGFTKHNTVVYLPDDDYVEVQLITLLDNVGDVRGSVLSGDRALTLAAG